MKQLLLSLLLFMNMQFLLGQGNVQELSPLYESRPEVSFNRFIGNDKSGFFAEFYDKKTKSNSIDKYDANGKKLFSAKLKDEAEYVIQSENNMYVFSVDYDKPGKKAKLFLTDINAETGVKAAPVMLSELDVIKHLDFNYTFSLSPDKTKLLVVSCFWAMSEEMQEKCIFQFYELKGMKKIWEKEIDGRYDDMYIKTKRYVCDNEGNVFLFFSAHKDIPQLRQKAYDGSGGYGTILAKDKNLNPISISLDTKMMVYSSSQMFTNDGLLMIVGFMREKNLSEADMKNNPPTKGGVFCAFYDFKTKKVVRQKENMFDEKTDQKLRGEKFGAGDVLFSIYKIEEINGDYYLVGYEYDVYTPIVYVTSGSPGLHEGDIMMAKMKSTGDIDWIKTMPRSVSAASTGFQKDLLSFSCFVKNDKFHFLYLENNVNAGIYSINDPSRPKKFRSADKVHQSNAVLSTIDLKGNATSKIVFENKAKAAWLIPDSKGVFVGNSLFVYFKNPEKKENYFGILTP